MTGTSSYWGSARWTEWGAADTPNIDADDDTTEYQWPMPVDVTRFAMKPSTSVVNAAGVVAVELYRNNDGGDAGEDTLLGTWTVTDTTTIAAGSISMGRATGHDADGETAEDATTRYVGGTGPWRIEPGEGFVIKVVDESDSGAVVSAVEYIPVGYPQIVENDVVRVSDAVTTVA